MHQDTKDGPPWISIKSYEINISLFEGITHETSHCTSITPRPANKKLLQHIIHNTRFML